MGVWPTNPVAPSYATATLPAAGQSGRLARLTDGVRGLWMDQGSQWFGLAGQDINVKEFGAVGDGITNDAPAIQAALDAANAAGGGTVWVPRGAYLLGTGLTVYARTLLKGAGYASRLLVTATGITAVTLAGDSAAIISCRLSGTGVAADIGSADAAHGVKITGQNYCGVLDCDFDGTPTFGIYLLASDSDISYGHMIAMNRFVGMPNRPIQCSNATYGFADCAIVNNYLSGWGQGISGSGITIQGNGLATGNRVHGNRLVNKAGNGAGNGITINYCLSTIVDSNTIEIGYDSADCIDVYRSYQTVVSNNTLQAFKNGAGSQATIQIENGSSYSTVQGNTCTGAPISVTDYSQWCSVVGNTVFNSGKQGIVLTPGSTALLPSGHDSSYFGGHTVIGNTVQSCGTFDAAGQPGIDVADALDTTICENVVRHCRYGVRVTSSVAAVTPVGVVISGNAISDTVTVGVLIQGASAVNTMAGVIVSKNTIVPANSSIGVYLTNVEGASCSGNAIDRAGDYGLLLGDAFNCEVADNVITNSTGQAIVLSYTSSSNHISGNKCYDRAGAAGTQTYGVAIISADATGNVVTDNDLRDNKTASVYNVGTGSVFRNNRGHVTENKGTATVANGATTVVVTHGLNQTPALTDIQVTPTLLSNATKAWISTPTATQFTINVDQDPGAGTAAFVWQAQIL